MRRIFLKKVVSLNPSIAGKNINIEFNLVQEGTSCHVIEEEADLLAFRIAKRYNSTQYLQR